MAECTFMLTQLLFISWFLMAHCSQPNCSSVEDFNDCLGNTIGFCPNSIACACKDGKPFCKCPSFRGQWGNYWYMGEKCEQLWNTLDLVLVATLPGIALAIIVGVAIQIIHYCKGKSKKHGDHNRVESSMSELRPQHNSAYGFGTDRNLSQPNQGEVNTETCLLNKRRLQKTPKREMPQRVKAEFSDVKSKYQKMKLHQCGIVGARFYINYQ